MTDQIIVQVGPDITAKGGIASVLAGYEGSKPLFEAQGFELRFLSTTSNSALGTLAAFLSAIAKTFFLCSFGKINLLHIHTSIRGSLVRKLALAAVCKITGGRFILHLHSGQFVSYFDGLPSMFKQIVKYFLKNAECVICLSELTKRELIDRDVVISDRCKVVYNGIKDPISPQEDHKKRNGNKVTIAFLGKIIESKGIFVLIEAVRQMAVLYPNFKLIVGGNGEDERFLREIKNPDFVDVVEFAGWIDGSQKIDLMNDMDIFVLPSRSEGFSVAIVEAMAWSSAIVSTKIPGVVEAVEDGVSGLLVPSDDAGALRTALERLIKEGETRDEMGNAARMRFVQNFTMEKIVEKLIDIYSTVN